MNLDPLLDTIARMRDRIDRMPNTRWGTVTSTSPLRVQMDADPSPMSAAPDNVVGPLVTGQRVRVEFANRRATITGTAQGLTARPGITSVASQAEQDAYVAGLDAVGVGPASGNAAYVWRSDLGEIHVREGSGWRVFREQEDTGWLNLTLMTGWSAKSGHAPRARRVGNTVMLEGAVYRGMGGSLAAIAQLPAPVNQAIQKYYFCGGSTTIHDDNTVRHSELLVNGSGIVYLAPYTTIDNRAGWHVPLTCTFGVS